MNRLLLTAMLWHAVLSFGAAQGATLFSQVVGSTGHVGVQQGLQYSYTVGETVIATLSSDNRILTQGFHQPEQTKIVSVGDPDFVDWDIQVFPNPVTDVLTVRVSADKGNALRVTVVDLVGSVILQEEILAEPDGSQVDCRSWQPGVYFIVLRDPAGRGMASTRVVKL